MIFFNDQILKKINRTCFNTGLCEFKIIIYLFKVIKAFLTVYDI